MKCMELYLNQFYPFLGEEGRNPQVKAYFPDHLSEMAREDEKRPCLIVCPGGRYKFCSQREAEPVALQFLPEGFHVFVLNYSVFPHGYPSQLRQVAALLELIHQNADLWHCDTSHIAIIGFSAGGHLAAHYSAAYDCDAIRAMFPDSKPVTAALLCYPVITADPAWAHTGSFQALTGSSAISQAQIAALSCEKLVNSHTPPTFLWHTADDTTVPVMNSLLYAQALAAHKIPFELHIYPYGNHGLSICDRSVCENLQPYHYHNHLWLDSAKKWLKLIWNME